MVASGDYQVDAVRYIRDEFIWLRSGLRADAVGMLVICRIATSTSIPRPPLEKEDWSRLASSGESECFWTKHMTNGWRREDS